MIFAWHYIQQTLLNWVKWYYFFFLIGLRVRGRSPTTTMSQVEEMNVLSICSMRVLHMEGIASSQRRLCSPSGPKLTKSDFSTHHGNFPDLDCSTMEPKRHFIDRCIHCLWLLVMPQICCLVFETQFRFWWLSEMKSFSL